MLLNLAGAECARIDLEYPRQLVVHFDLPGDDQWRACRLYVRDAGWCVFGTLGDMVHHLDIGEGGDRSLTDIRRILVGREVLEAGPRGTTRGLYVSFPDNCELHVRPTYHEDSAGKRKLGTYPRAVWPYSFVLDAR